MPAAMAWERHTCWVWEDEDSCDFCYDWYWIAAPVGPKCCELHVHGACDFLCHVAPTLLRLAGRKGHNDGWADGHKSAWDGFSKLMVEEEEDRMDLARISSESMTWCSVCPC